MWPSKEELKGIIEDEKEFEPSLETLIAEVEREKAELAEERRLK